MYRYSVLIFCILIFTFFPGGSDAAVRSNARTRPTVEVTARAATNSRTAPRAAAPAANTGAKTVNRGRAATNTASKAPVVAARAGTTQKVIGTGTKVAGAAKNTAISQSCQDKWNGCLDTFCMLDNETGGRCICSNRIIELDKQLSEIEKLDSDSWALATVGVETIETGVDISAVKSGYDKKSDNERDLSTWFLSNVVKDDEVKRGDKLFAHSVQICRDNIPECSDNFDMLQMMYAQRIKSDCAAYENSLKQQKNASQQKLSTAERALREAALEQLRTANKYDLGQCTIEFKKCMQTTGGCGTDFSGCAIMSALDNSTDGIIKSTSTAVKNYQIKGSQSSIEISASTYDALLSKKPLCETVTKSCVAVADQVWDTFLREVAPQIKNAEIIAEDKARQDCVGNISNCFQKACKDNIDPKDPDGSFDMCITRPETMFHVCKVPLNTCGIDASSVEKAEKSNIWEFVVARLASMRVDSCTAAVKECLQSEDRCGSDYTQCIGLDTDSIIRMCPYDKLVGCQQKYGENDEILGDKVYDELARLVQGIMLNIDNNFLTQCQNAVNEAMIRVCGDTENCDNLTVDDNIGARSLEYKICEYVASDSGFTISMENCRQSVDLISDEELGRVRGATNNALGPAVPFMGLLDGMIYWEGVTVNEQGRLTDFDEYLAQIDMTDMTDLQKQRVRSEIDSLQVSVDNVVAAIEADPTVQYCMAGRRVQGMNDTTWGRGKDAARFPNLTKQMRMIVANSALKKAKDNYYQKYDELNERMLNDYGVIAERQAEIRGENGKDARREMARYSCVALADLAGVPKSPAPPKGIGGKIVIGIIVVAAIVVASVFTFGAAGIAAGAGAAAATSTSTLATAAAAGAQAAAAVSATATITTTGALSAGTLTLSAGPAAALSASIAASHAAISSAATAAMTTSLAASALTANVAMSVGGAALVAGGAMSLADKNTDGSVSGSNAEMSGFHEMEQWNYRQKITTTFDWNNITCEKCVESQNCEDVRLPLFGKKKCKKWGEKKTSCSTTQF